MKKEMTSTKFFLKPNGKMYFLNPSKDELAILNDMRNALTKSGMVCSFNRKFRLKNDKFTKKVLCFEYDLSYGNVPFCLNYSSNTPAMKSFTIFCTELSKKFYELM